MEKLEKKLTTTTQKAQTNPNECKKGGKRRKKRNLSTQSELLLNLYLSLACHVNYKQTPFKRILKSNSKTPSDTHWFLKWTSFLYSSEFGIIPTSK